MKTNNLLSRPAVLTALAVSSFLSPAALRAEGQPSRGLTVAMGGREEAQRPLEEVTFLGISTHGIDAALASQMDLPPETGLVIVHILPDSPAAGVLKQHDLLTRFDDQILIEPRQLGVLVRSRKEGDEVKLTLFRGGKPQTVRVKLGKKAMPPLPEHFVPGMRRTLQLREEVPMVFSRPAVAGPFTRRGDRAEMRISLLDTKDATMFFDDGEGRLEVSFKDGKKRLTARNKQGDVVFSGPVETAEERKALPAEVRERFEKMEAMDVRVPAPPLPPDAPLVPSREGPETSSPARGGGREMGAPDAGFFTAPPVDAADAELV